MKKLLTLAAILSFAFNCMAEKKPLELTIEDVKPKKEIILLPTASIDGQVLTISFVTNCAFEVSVVDASGAVVYTGTYNAQSAVITLPNLPCGDYELEIEDATHIYGGEFEIEQ